MTAIVAAMGGIPFYCHDAMGWKPGEPNYPAGLEKVDNAIRNLLSAPKLIHDLPGLQVAIADATPTGVPSEIFDADRALIGRAPACAGWKMAVSQLAEAGWFKDKTRRAWARAVANQTLKELKALKAEPKKEIRTKHLRNIKKRLRELSGLLHQTVKINVDFMEGS